jgi:hypothetical protein
MIVDLAGDEEPSSGDDTPRASMRLRSPIRVAATASEEPPSTTVVSPDSESLPSPWMKLSRPSPEALPSMSTALGSSAAIPAAASMTAYVTTMQSELQRLAPPPPPRPSNRQALRKRREVLFKHVLKDSIISAKATESANTLRTTIAEEVKTFIQDLLTTEEQDPRHTLMTIRSRGKSYWSTVHQEVHQGNLNVNTMADHVKTIDVRQPTQPLYSPRDVKRTLYFWATHQHVMSYGEIAYELCLPLGVLVSWIIRYIDYI